MILSKRVLKEHHVNAPHKAQSGHRQEPQELCGLEQLRFAAWQHAVVLQGLVRARIRGCTLDHRVLDVPSRVGKCRRCHDQY